MSATGKVGPIALEVAQLEEKYDLARRELSEIHNTLFVNFGPAGRVKQLLNGDESTQKMIYTIVADLLQ